jgi:hypothetical protein
MKPDDPYPYVGIPLGMNDGDGSWAFVRLEPVEWDRGAVRITAPASYVMSIDTLRKALDYLEQAGRP